MRGFAALALFAALLASCGEPESPPRTLVLVVWDSVDVEQLHACGAKHDTTPNLTALAREGEVDAAFGPGTTSATASVARHLEAPGSITSIRELGYDRLDPEQGSLAHFLDLEGWRTIGSASQAHFTYAGFGLGFDVWRAPEFVEGSRPWGAEQVFGEIRGDLTAALRSDEPVFVFLHFEDLRGRKWIDRSDPGPWLETFLAPWRGEDETIDSALDVTIKDSSPLNELKKQLLRRRGDERRTVLLEALYAGELARLDAVLGQVFDELRRAGRFENAEVRFVGGPAVLPEDVASRDAPGARLVTARISRQWPDDWLRFAHTDQPIAPFPPGWLVTVDGRSGWVHGQDGIDGEVARLRQFAQRLSISFQGVEGEVLDVTATSPEAELDLLEPGVDLETFTGEVQSRPPNANTRRFSLPASQECGIVPERCGVDLILRLAREGLTEGDLRFGGDRLDETDLPVMLGRKGPAWPDGLEPALDLRPAAGRRDDLVVPGPEGAQVELLVETIPPLPALLESLRGTGFEAEAHPLRPGAVLVRGTAPLTVGLPARTPSTRLGVVLRVDGERIETYLMRSGKRRFRSPGELEIGFGAGVWLDRERLRFPLGEQYEAVRIELHGGGLGRPGYPLPTPAERKLLERLDENE